MKNIRINQPTVIYKILGDEAVLINYENGKYYWVEKIAASLLSSLEQGIYEIDSLGERLSNRYNIKGIDISKDINDFIEQLRAESLIVDDDNIISNSRPASESPNQPLEKLPYEKPILHVFDDMQELIKLDPVHEIDGRGWPHLMDK
ncbi:MAG: PqqD family protein [Candidatus Omnitrophica bacterium]|nr:PqqD family protein [Candidatus Omnitrophota bacterium]